MKPVRPAVSGAQACEGRRSVVAFWRSSGQDDVGCRFQLAHTGPSSGAILLVEHDFFGYPELAVMFADSTGSARPGDHSQLETLKAHFAHSNHAGQWLGYHEAKRAYRATGQPRAVQGLRASPPGESACRRRLRPVSWLARVPRGAQVAPPLLRAVPPSRALRASDNSSTGPLT